MSSSDPDPDRVAVSAMVTFISLMFPVFCVLFRVSYFNDPDCRCPGGGPSAERCVLQGPGFWNRPSSPPKHRDPTTSPSSDLMVRSGAQKHQSSVAKSRDWFIFCQLMNEVWSWHVFVVRVNTGSDCLHLWNTFRRSDQAWPLTPDTAQWLRPSLG